jgi:hypothetical protein
MAVWKSCERVRVIASLLFLDRDYAPFVSVRKMKHSHHFIA